MGRPASMFYPASEACRALRKPSHKSYVFLKPLLGKASRQPFSLICHSGSIFSSWCATLLSCQSLTDSFPEVDGLAASGTQGSQLTIVARFSNLDPSPAVWQKLFLAPILIDQPCSSCSSWRPIAE